MKSGEKTHAENIVLGGGPAGLQLAYFLGQRSQDYLVLERADHAGAFFDEQPRHRKLLSINKRYTGYPDLESRLRYDWNSLLGSESAPQFTDFSEEYFPSADALPRYLASFEQYHQLRVRYRVEIEEITKDGELFRLRTNSGETFTCAKLFVATGLAQENVPNFEGVELCKTYGKMPVDPEAYADHRVLIVGKGNSAFETADALINTTQKIWVCGPNTVRLAWASHYVGDLRAVNNNFLDTYQLKAQNNILDGDLRSVRRARPDSDELIAEVYFESRKRCYEYRCDDVLLCTGFRFDRSVYGASAQPEMRHCGRLPLMTSEWESVNVPNMYFAGTLMQSRDYRKTMSGFIHGFRHNIDSLDRVLELKDGHPWRGQETLELDSEALSTRLIERISTSASLLLQPGFLVDVIVVDKDGGKINYLPEVPLDYATEKLLPSAPHAYVVSLEYKESDDLMDPFAMPRGVKVPEDFYIHPILRRYEYGQVTGRLFLPDDLDNDWRGEKEHWDKLLESFEYELAGNTVRPVPKNSFIAELSTASDTDRKSRTGGSV